MIALLVMTDGRDDLLARTLASWAPILDDPLITERWCHDDTGVDEHRATLRDRYGFNQLAYGRPRVGFTAAMGRAWKWLSETSQADYILHLEDDFLIEQKPDLTAMVDVLQSRPYLTQMALRRQPWSDEERRHGGIVEAAPAHWADMTDGTHQWLERRGFWTCNPCLYRRSLCARGWPQVSQSEPAFAHSLFEDPAAQSGYWGTRSSGVWVRHIGQSRMGHGY